MRPRASPPWRLLRACMHPAPLSQDPLTTVLRDSEPHPDGVCGNHRSAQGGCGARDVSCSPGPPGTAVEGTQEAAEQRSPCTGLTLSPQASGLEVSLLVACSGSSPLHMALSSWWAVAFLSSL